MDRMLCMVSLVMEKPVFHQGNVSNSHEDFQVGSASLLAVKRNAAVVVG